MLPAEFEAGLMDIRFSMQGVPNFGTYYIDSVFHTWIRPTPLGGQPAAQGDSFYDTMVNGVRLVDWFRDIVEGRPPTHVGP
jgi:hypothetical protein